MYSDIYISCSIIIACIKWMEYFNWTVYFSSARIKAWNLKNLNCWKLLIERIFGLLSSSTVVKLFQRILYNSSIYPGKNYFCLELYLFSQFRKSVQLQIYTILFWLILRSLNENNEVVLESCKERSGKMEVHSKLASNVVSQPNVVSYELHIMENCVIKSEASNYVRY